MHAIRSVGRTGGMATSASRDRFHAEPASEVTLSEEEPATSLLRCGLCSPLKWALIILVWSGATQPIYAVPLYSGSINTNGVLDGVNSSPNPVVLGNYLSIVDTDPGGNSIGLKTTGVDAVANYGRLRGSSFSDYLNTRDFYPIFSGGGIGNQEGSYFSLDDLVITGPPGNILISFNFVLAGGVIAMGGGNAQPSSAQAEATMGYQSTFGGAGNVDIGKIGLNNNGSGYSYGIFSTFPMNGNGTATGMTPDILTYAGDAALNFSLGLTMSTGAGVGYGAPQGYAYGSSQFTLGFPTSGPVANLPEGYTLNSISGQIVDNRFVPEPASAAILTLCGMGMLIRRRFGHISLPAGRVGQVRTRVCSPLKWTLALAVACAGLAATQTVHAAPQYYGSIPGVETISASPTPVYLTNRTEIVVRDQADNVIGQATHQEIAAAGYGQVRGSSNADFLNTHPHFPYGFWGTGAQESSSFSLDDLVITGPPGNILVSFNFTISGSIGGNTVSTGNPAFYNWYADARAFGGIGSTFGAGGFDIGTMHADFSGAFTRSGIFSTFSVNSEGTAMGTSPEILTFAGDTELGFSLSLETSASVGVGFGGEPGNSNAYASFANTFGFPTSGSVANLPEGYTLNSVSGNIVDNRFVPEPASATILALAASVMLFTRRFGHIPLPAGRVLVLFVWCVGSWTTQTVYGAPLYSGFVNVPGAPEAVNDSPAPVVLDAYQSIVDYWGADAIGTKTSAADAVASYGRLRGNSFADYLNVSESIPGSFGGTGTFAQSSSYIFLDDLFVSGPPGNIMVSLNVAISGGVFADNGGSAYVQSSAGATASTALGSDFGGSGADLGAIGVDANGNLSATGIFSTFPANGNGTGIGTTPEIQTYAGAVIRFSLKLETGANVSVGSGAGPGSYYASSNFMHTFGFPTSGPVANLPEGYTLNSISGHIVDNRFVPEPTGAALLIACGAGMLFRRRF